LRHGEVSLGAIELPFGARDGRTRLLELGLDLPEFLGPQLELRGQVVELGLARAASRLRASIFAFVTAKAGVTEVMSSVSARVEEMSRDAMMRPDKRTDPPGVMLYCDRGVVRVGDRPPLSYHLSPGEHRDCSSGYDAVD